VNQPDKIWTTLGVLTWTRQFLAEKGVENARLEAEWMLCEATGLDRIGLYLNFDKPLLHNELRHYRSMVTRRAGREPLQYILGSQEFDGLDFIVTRDVLIPRHDTETLIKAVILHASDVVSILDIGTGSGCIAVSLAHHLPKAQVTAIDISPEALSVAIRNAETNNVSIEFLHGSFFEPVKGRCFDIIVSNPPYITTAEISGLQPEVRDFEPLLALDGGPDGLAAYRKLATDAPGYLNIGGRFFVETGAGQADDVLVMLKNAGFADLITLPDSSGIQRVAGGVFYGKD